MNEVAIREPEQARIVNGINVGALSETVNAIRNDPELGSARFRVTNKWVSGNHNRSTVTDFFGAKQ